MSAIYAYIVARRSASRSASPVSVLFGILCFRKPSAEREKNRRRTSAHLHHSVERRFKSKWLGESNRPHNRAEARSRMYIIICHPDVFSVVGLHNPPSTDCMMVIFLMICDYGFCGPVMNLIGCRQNHARFMFLT